MSKSKIITIFFAVSLLSVLSLSPASAQGGEAATSTVAAEDQITISDLGVEKTGILPTNPFYFIKEWGREIQSLIIFDPVKKAEHEIKVANEKAAELKSISENNPEDLKSLERAISNYNKNVDRLRARLEALKENSDNPKIDELLNQLTDRAVKHEQLFEELKARHEVLRDRLEQAQDKLDEAVLKVPEKLDNPDKFKERIKNALDNQKESHLKELRAVKFLSRIDSKASSTEVREKLLELTDDKLQSSTVRKAIEKEVGAEKAAEMIKQAKEALADLEAAIEKVKASGSEVERKRLNSIGVLFDRARTSLREAEEFYKGERYGAAYGQANSARVAARNALAQLLKRVEENKPVACTLEYAPVCGLDGKTYSNTCFLKAANTGIAHKGECKSEAPIGSGTTTEPERSNY